MRFSEIDIFVMFSRILGGLILAAGVAGCAYTFFTRERGAVLDFWPWIALALSGVWLVNFCTGVLAQIVAARATQDTVEELKALRESLRQKA